MEQHGSKAAAARAFRSAEYPNGMPVNTFKGRYDAENLLTDEQRDLCGEFGIRPEHLQGGWVKSAGASYRFKIPDPKDDPGQILDAIREGLADIGKAVALPTPRATLENMSTVYPIADLHVGLLTDEEETGENWDTKVVTRVFRDRFERLLSLNPPTQEAVIAQLGDLTHTDDQQNVTPQSKHQLDVDSRYFVILRRAVALMKFAIDSALRKHGTVIYRGCRGNHDITTHYAVTLALSEHYRNEPRVTIEDSANEFYVYEFGLSMFLLCHGDKAKAAQLSMFAASEFPEIWGRTKFRRALTAHLHQERVLQAGGMLVETIGTMIPRDAYAHSNGYSAMRSLVSIVLDRQEGEVSRHRVSLC